MARPPARIDDQPGKRGRGPTKRLLEATERQLAKRLAEETDPKKIDELLKVASRLAGSMIVATGPSNRQTPRLRKTDQDDEPEEATDDSGETPGIDMSDLAFADYSPKEKK